MKYEGILLYIDGVEDAFGETFSSKCKVSVPHNDIAVYHDFRTKPEDFVTTAQLAMDLDKKVVMYKLDITPTDRFPQKTIDLLTPVVSGQIIKRSGKELESIKITGIGLVLNPADTRLKKLGDSSENSKRS